MRLLLLRAVEWIALRALFSRWENHFGVNHSLRIESQGDATTAHQTLEEQK